MSDNLPPPSSPKVSIVVPVYNAEKYIRRCIESLIHQTLPEIEIILVDDGSPDNSGKICDEYAKKDNRIKVIHKQNGGVSSARNTGLKNAGGEYIAFVDADDYVEKDMCTLLYSKAIEHCADIVLCGISRASKNNGQKVLHSVTDADCVYHTKSEFLSFFTALRAQPANAIVLHSPFNKLYKSSLLNGEWFNEKVFTSEDYIFNLSVFDKVSTAVALSDCPYFYEENEASATHTIKEEYIYSIYCAIEETFSFYKRNNLPLKSAKRYLKSIFYTIVSIYYIIKSEHGTKTIPATIHKKLSWAIIFADFCDFKSTILLLLFKIRASSVLTFITAWYTKKNAHKFKIL